MAPKRQNFLIKTPPKITILGLKLNEFRLNFASKFWSFPKFPQQIPVLVGGLVRPTDGQIVNPGSQHGPHMAGEDGDDPPVVVGLREHVQAPAGHNYNTADIIADGDLS